MSTLLVRRADYEATPGPHYSNGVLLGEPVYITDADKVEWACFDDPRLEEEPPTLKNADCRTQSQAPKDDQKTSEVAADAQPADAKPADVDPVKA